MSRLMLYSKHADMADAMTEVPSQIIPALQGLHEMLAQFRPEQMAQGGIPLEFWLIADDDALFDALQYLPNHVLTRGGRSGQGLTDDEIDELPEGFRVVMAIFKLEEELANEGWSGLNNVSDEQIARTIDAYMRVGLKARASALKRVLAAWSEQPDDQSALRRAAGGALRELADDSAAFEAIARFVRTDSPAKFGVMPKQRR